VATISVPSVLRKLNVDGTWNCICVSCFQTIAANLLEVEVDEVEKLHICRSSLLSQRGVRASLSTSR
jgi:hypothetical protein